MIINGSKKRLVRYLNPADYRTARVTKADKNFAKTLNFKDIKFPVKIRDTNKIENKNSTGISVFGYERRKNIQSMYQKNVVKKNMLA